MAWRETRAGWRSFAGLIACVALGVAAVVGVGGVGASLDRALSREGKSLLGGDLELRSARPLDDDARSRLGRLTATGATATDVRELVAMAREPGRGTSLLVELKTVGREYPLYGRLETQPEQPLSELLRDDGALVEDALLGRLGVAVGSRIVLGVAPFTIRGVIVKEPDRAGGLSLGPRVLIADDRLERTGLVTIGSRVRHRTLVRLPATEGAGAVRETLARELADPAVRVVAWDEAQPGLRRFFTQLTTYLGLVGLASLFVGGIGVASAVRALVRRRRETIAILKVLGAETRTLLTVYVVQTLGLGLLGSALGAAVGLAAQPLIVRALRGFVPFALDARGDVSTVARALAMGTLMAALVALWPLLSIRGIGPALILRHDVDPAARGGRRPWAAVVPLAFGLTALAVWQAGSLKLGLIFVGAALAALATLGGLARGLAVLARWLPRPPGIAWRQGWANLARPGGHAVGVVVALGVGVMLLVATAILESSLGRQIDLEQRREAPSFFFVDLQPDQRERFIETVRGASGGIGPSITPVVRARLAAVGNEPITREGLDRRRAAGHEALWYFTRDYVLTAAATPPPGNAVVRGRWWTPANGSARIEASVEEAAAKHLGVDVGDTLAFDVQGVRLEADVTSVRKVDWQSLSTNFFVILSPGALDGAPTTFVATARIPGPAEARVQDAVVANFPNVVVVPVRDVLERVAVILGQIGVAVRTISLVTIAAGLVVMAGALAASRYQRLSESVILRTLGATRGLVARIFAVEYACLGAAAGLGGSLLASALAGVVLHFVLDLPWTLEPHTLALGVGMATSLGLAVGFFATFRLLGQKPLPVLRRE